MEFNIYGNENINLDMFDLEFEDNKDRYNKIKLNFMKLSDFNNILQNLGLEPYELKKNEYILGLSTNREFENIGRKIIESDKPLILDNNKLVLKEAMQDFVAYNGGYQNIFVIDDSIFNDSLKPIISILNINTKTSEDELNLCNLLNKYNEDEIKYFYNDKTSLYESAIPTNALIAFIGIYIGVVFIITCSTILAIQQISEATHNKYRYNLLKKLGAEKVC